MNKIILGIPCYKTISVRTAWSIMDILRKHPEVEVAFQDGVFVHENQNNLVKLAQERGASHIWLVEHDMIFEPETLNKLLADNKDIICANYNFRSEPRQSMVFRFNAKGELENIPQRELPKETFEAGAIPTGLTLIKTDVFKKLTKPYFFYKYNSEGKMESSQDVYFCNKAREAGLSVWCNPTIEVGHLGENIY